MSRTEGAEGADVLGAAVDRALEARRDPLDDDAVLAALVDAPQRFAEIARLADDALALREVDQCEVGPGDLPGAARRRRAAGLAVAAAAIALVATALALDAGRWWSRSADGPTPVAEAQGARVAPERPRAIVDELRLSARSGPWNTDGPWNTGSTGFNDSTGASTTVVLTRAATGPTTIVRTAGAIAPDGSRTTISIEERIR